VSVARPELRGFVLGATTCALLLALPIALVASAVAELAIAVAAVPVALVVARDPYVALLAPSFGVSAAAAVVQWLLAASPLWALLWPIVSARRSTSALASASGAVVALAALILSEIAVAHWPGPLAQHTAIARPDPFTAIVAIVVGAAAGFVAAWWDRRTYADGVTPGWRATAMRSIVSVAAFALALGLGLESIAALRIALGR
jgi:hypothetical protein